MTDEEMAAELIARGWFVQPPRHSATCGHKNMWCSVYTTAAGMRTVGRCPDCGYVHEQTTAAPSVEYVFTSLQDDAPLG